MSSKQLTYRQFAWIQFKKNKAALISFYILFVLFIIAIISPFIANDQPLYIKYHGERFYPAFRTLTDKVASDQVVNHETGDTIKFIFKDVDWRRIELDNVWWALVPYSPNRIDNYNRDYTGPNVKQRLLNYKGNMIELPSRLRHVMGTDKLGRDVASGLIHGTRISLSVGLLSMLIATVIGLFLGGCAGFYGDFGINLTRLQFWFIWLGVIVGYFYGFSVRKSIVVKALEESVFYGTFQAILGVVILILIVLVFSKIGRLLSFGRFLSQKVNFPIDSYVNRIIEILNSIPLLILIISLSSLMSGGSVAMLIIIIGITGWTGVARLIRAEILRIRQLEYIQAARVLGFSDIRIVLKHAIPNGLAPVFVTFAFGVASAILTESGLSFLGIGVPPDTITWGSLLSLGRAEFEAWWLVLYPGLAIFITITVYNLIGEGLRDALDPKHKK